MFIFVTLLILCSCARLPIYESLEYATTDSNNFLNPVSSHFDKKFNINYGVANNDSDLFIQAIFHDRASYMQMMRGGLTVYFDPTGKKKKSNKLKIERFISPNANQRQQEQRPGSTQGVGQTNMVRMINQTYKKGR